MPAGGRRPGAGRPPGAHIVKTAEIATKLALDGGISPLEVMELTMRELWADAMATRGKKKRRELMIQACNIAERVGPFRHPRLSAITAELTGKNGAPIAPVLNVIFESKPADAESPPAS